MVPNRWVTLVSESRNSTLAGSSFEGSDCFAGAPVALQAGGRCTVPAEWDDGRAVLVIVRGHDPQAAAPSPSDLCLTNGSGSVL